MKLKFASSIIAATVVLALVPAANAAEKKESDDAVKMVHQVKKVKPVAMKKMATKKVDVANQTKQVTPAKKVQVALQTKTPAAATKPEIVNVLLTGEGGQPMGVKFDVPTIKAGTVEFDVKNDAIGTDHEAVLVKLKTKDDKISADPTSHRVDEKMLQSLGEVAGLKAGATGNLKVKLQPGEYAMICNHKGHYELGMSTRFTVVQ